jgi:hypothetical protein
MTTDNMNAIIRRAAGFTEPEQQPEPAVPGFDGGARTPAPPAPPSMNERLRAAVLAKDGIPLDQALRQVRFEQMKEN